jgi:hypothetical protein
LRKSAVETVIGIIKSVMRFRPFLLRAADDVPANGIGCASPAT